VILIRIVIALVFVLSGISKLENGQAAEKLLGACSSTINQNYFLKYYLIKILAVFELFVAGTLFVKRLRLFSFYLSILLIIFFSLYLMLLFFMGVDLECGCFGNFIPNTSISLAFMRNIAIILIVSFGIYYEKKNNCK